MPRLLRVGAVVVALLVLVALAASVTLGKDLLAGKLRADRTITVPADEHVEGDLYLVAGTIIVNGTIDGDLVAMGSDVRVSGTVGGDLIVGAGSLVVDGTVKGDARVAGGRLTLSGEIGEDLLLAGGTAEVTDSGSIGGDLILAAGTATMDGSVAGSIEGTAGTYARHGTVGGTEHITLGRAGEPPAPRTAGDAIGDGIRHFVAVLLFGAVGLWLLPGGMRAAEGLVRRRPLPALGVGLLVWAVYVVGALALSLLLILLLILFAILTLGNLAAVTVIGGLLALLVGTFALIVLASFVTDAVVGLALARLVAPAMGTGRWGELGLLAGGAAVIVAVSTVPVVGGIVKLAVVLVGLGAMALAAWNMRRRQAPAAEAAASQ